VFTADASCMSFCHCCCRRIRRDGHLCRWDWVGQVFLVQACPCCNATRAHRSTGGVNRAWRMFLPSAPAALSLASNLPAVSAGFFLLVLIAIVNWYTSVLLLRQCRITRTVDYDTLSYAVRTFDIAVLKWFIGGAESACSQMHGHYACMLPVGGSNMTLEVRTSEDKLI